MADPFFSLSPTVLLGVFREKSSRVAPMEIRPPGFLIRSWSQEMWFRPLLGGGCVDSTDGAEQTDGRRRSVSSLLTTYPFPFIPLPL